MDAEKLRKAGVRFSIRSVIFTIAVVAAAIVPVIWAVRQSRLTQEALTRARAAEEAAMQAQTHVAEARDQVRGKARILRDGAVRRAARRDPKDGERVHQLSAEIDALMHIQDGIQEDLRGIRRQMATLPTVPGAHPSPEPKPEPSAGSR